METSDYNGYRQNIQDKRQRCKIKVRKFLLISYGVLELWRKNPKGERGFCSPPVKEHLHVKLKLADDHLMLQSCSAC